MTKFESNIEVLDPEDPIAKVIGLMRERNQSEAFIDEKERTGIVTLRDLLKVRNITATKISTLMSYVPRLNPNNTVGDAAALMFEHRIRSLPIYENGRKATGKIDSFSIIEKLIETRPDEKITRLMTPNPITVDSDDDIGKARRLMIRRKIDQIPVRRGGKLISVVGSDTIVYKILPSTDRDIKGNSGQGRFEQPVQNFAYSDYVQNEVSDSLRKVFENMRSSGRTYSVITSFDEIQGIVTHRDFMKIFTSVRPTDGIPMYIVGLPSDPFEAEAAREKFERIIKLVRKGHPDTIEARAIIKSGQTRSVRKKYQVQIFISSPKRRYNYTAFGFELPNVFDEIENWAKKLVVSHDKRRRRTRADPGAISSEKADLWVH